MKPLTGTKAWPTLAVYDLEATEWTNIILVCHMDEFGNKVHFDTVAEYLEWLFNTYQGDHVWAHWGGHYDHRFVIQHATRRGWSWETIQSGGQIIIVSIRHPSGRVIHFAESARLLPDSVERIGKTVGLAKLDVDRTNIGTVSRETLIEYCFRDCEIILKGLAHLRDAFAAVGADFAYTLASIASRWVRRSKVLDWFRFYEKDELTGKQVYSKKMLTADTFAMPAYFGGRVEVFRRGTFQGPLYYYDVRSSYPWAMTHELPAYFKQFTTPNKRNITTLRRCGITEATVTVPEDTYLPVLAVRHAGKLIFPTGTFRGRWTNVDLLAAYERGASVEIHGCADFKPLPFLRSFVGTFFGLREAAIKAGDAFKSYAYKIALNSLYGKLVESVERQSIVYGPFYVSRVLRLAARTGELTVKPTSVPGVYGVVRYMDGPFRHVAAGAYVTSYSRLRLLEGLETAKRLGGSVYYCDTDSIVTNVQLDAEPLCGTELGKFKLEATFSEAEFVSPKVYRAVMEDGHTLYKVKGMPVRGLTDAESAQKWSAYLSGEGVQRDGISGFRTDIRRGTIEPRAEVLSRALRGQDTKRRHRGDESLPLFVGPSGAVGEPVDKAGVISESA